MKNQLSSIVLTLFFISCSRDQPRWTYEEVENFKPERIQLGSCTLDGLKLRTTKETLLHKWGQPTRQIDGAGTFYGVDIRGKERYDTTVWFTAYWYDNVTFAVWSNDATIETIDFRKSETEINAPSFSLSAKTDLDYIQKKFPTSYDWRNMGINTAQDRLFDFEQREANEIELTWIDLINERGQNVELTFVDNKLVFLINTIVK